MPCYPGQVMKQLIQLPRANARNDCWLWKGPTNDKGYPVKTEGGRTIQGARWVWTIFNGPISRDLAFSSRCGNNLCVNPTHLRVMSWQQLNQENNSGLVIDDVRQIRHEADNGVPHALLAERFLVDPSTITRIVSRSSWKNVKRSCKASL